MKLYGYWRSSATWRVRIGLELKGIPFTYVPVNLIAPGGGEHVGEAHTARNPMQQLPVLEVGHGDGAVHLSQSLAILGYLDDVEPEPALWPADPLQRARVTQLAEVINAGIQPLQNLSLLRTIVRMGGDKLRWGHDAIARGFVALEAMAQATAGTFLVGDAVSAADCCLVPQVYNARRFGVDLAPFPTLTRVEATCAAMPAFHRAHADQQADAQRS